VARLQIHVARRETELSNEVLSMLTTWLMTHVLRADRLYVEYLPNT
jgi:hemerythrin